MIKSYIKNPQKTFDNLSVGDLRLLVEAYLNGENELFYRNSLDEFLLVPNRNPELEAFRAKINRAEELGVSSHEGVWVGTENERTFLINLLNGL